MHHKRGKPKSARAGCLLCKPHKHQAEKHRDRSRRKRDERWQVEQWLSVRAASPRRAVGS